MLIGYARVSRRDQELGGQLDALQRAGCQKVYQEKQSAAKHRPVLDGMCEHLRSGDTVVVARLDRLTRGGIRDLLARLDQIHGAGARVRSLSEPFDTSSALGDAMVQILGVFAQLERRMMIERTQSGLDAARRRGARLGRPMKLSPEQQREVQDLVAQDWSDARIARLVHVDRSTITRFRARLQRAE